MTEKYTTEKIYDPPFLSFIKMFWRKRLINFLMWFGSVVMVGVLINILSTRALLPLSLLIIVFLFISAILLLIWEIWKLFEATDRERIKFLKENNNLKILGPHKTGDSLTTMVNETEYTFVFCEKGNYCNKDGASVSISDNFWILDVPVTQQMWESVMHGNPSYFQTENDTDFFVKEGKRFKEVFKIESTKNFPVESVNRTVCELYLKELNKLLQKNDCFPKGLEASLPTREEWEYACRAGTLTNYSWGDVADENKANYNSSKKLGRTSEVRSFGPNPWNIFDMHGNVCEWTSSVNQYSDGILCGGSWQDQADSLKPENAKELSPTTKQLHSFMGFRFVLHIIPYNSRLEHTEENSFIFKK